MAADRPATPALRGAAARSVASNGISREAVAEARRLYETSALPGAAIAKRLGVGPTSVRRLARKHGWKRPQAVEERRKLVGSIRQKAEREIVAASRALKDGGDPGPAARTLASLVRTLRELAKYDEEQARAPKGAAADDDEDFDDVVADPDAFREALAERLERLRDGRET